MLLYVLLSACVLPPSSNVTVRLLRSFVYRHTLSALRARLLPLLTTFAVHFSISRSLLLATRIMDHGARELGGDVNV